MVDGSCSFAALASVVPAPPIDAFTLETLIDDADASALREIYYTHNFCILLPNLLFENAKHIVFSCSFCLYVRILRWSCRLEVSFSQFRNMLLLYQN